MVEFLLVLWFVSPVIFFGLVAFWGLDMLRRIEDLEDVVADYIDAFEPDEDL